MLYSLSSQVSYPTWHSGFSAAWPASCPRHFSGWVSSSYSFPFLLNAEPRERCVCTSLSPHSYRTLPHEYEHCRQCALEQGIRQINSRFNPEVILNKLMFCAAQLLLYVPLCPKGACSILHPLAWFLTL